MAPVTKLRLSHSALNNIGSWHTAVQWRISQLHFLWGSECLVNECNGFLFYELRTQTTISCANRSGVPVGRLLLSLE